PIWMVTHSQVSTVGILEESDDVALFDATYLCEQSENPSLDVLHIEGRAQRIESSEHISAKQRLSFIGIIRQNDRLSLLVVTQSSSAAGHVLVLRDGKIPAVFPNKFLLGENH